MKEKLIKSVDRVKGHGEVFTPKSVVDLMLNQPEIIEMLLEHIKIRSAMDRLFNEELNNEEIRELGSLLYDHIRKEERILFPMIEAALPEAKLQKLAPLLYD